MGGKAKKRREKNYLAAHGGGNTRLPPPPDLSTLDVVPSKLRKIMNLAGKLAIDSAKKKKLHAEKRQGSTDELGDKSDKIKRNDDDEKLVAEVPDHAYNVADKSTQKKKRKRNQVNDLRFEESDKLVGVGAKRKERRKLRNEVRKKKRKGNKEQEHFDSLDRDNVRFGDVVQAPPKLVSVPKGSKSTQVASQERQRIQAVEAYRQRKGWTSRPGLYLQPTLSTAPPS